MPAVLVAVGMVSALIGNESLRAEPAKTEECVRTLCDITKTVSETREAQAKLASRGKDALLPLLAAAKDVAKSTEGGRQNVRILQTVSLILQKDGLPPAPDAVNALAELAQSKDFVTSYWARKALGRIRSREIVPVLFKTLDDETAHPLAVLQTVESLGKTGSGDVALGQLIHHASPEIREAVCDALKEYQSLPALLALFRGLIDPNLKVRSAAIDQLKLLPRKDENREERMNYQADAPDEGRLSSVKTWFDWVLQRKMGDLTPEQWAEFYDTPLAEVRRKVLQNLGGALKASSLLCALRGLADTELSVREAAFEAMRQLNQGKLSPYRASAPAAERDGQVKGWFDWVAQQKVTGLQESDWTPLFLESGPAVRIALLAYLRTARTKAAVRCMVQGLKDPEAKVRKEASVTLKGLLGQEKEVSEYKPEGEEGERAAAVQAIERWLKKNLPKLSGY